MPVKYNYSHNKMETLLAVAQWTKLSAKHAKQPQSKCQEQQHQHQQQQKGLEPEQDKTHAKSAAR